MPAACPNCLELEDIFDMENFFRSKHHCSQEEARKFTKEAVDHFWISFRFVKYVLLYKFRLGASKYIRRLVRAGNIVEIYTSRAKTRNAGLVGWIARTLTIMQFYRNGVMLSPKQFHFFRSDQEKVAAIAATDAELAFDDKPEVIEALVSCGIKCICVNGHHNQTLEENKYIQKADDFMDETINIKIENLFDRGKLATYIQAANSDRFFHKLYFLRPLIYKYFSPIILHEENIIGVARAGVIYAPNHRSTLDPIIITGILKRNIHWAALKRFFEEKDSIFNNSKNHVLCKLTSVLFHKLIYFPIERKSDNPDANNLNSIRAMVRFLNANQPIGIFPEGTIRRPAGVNFGTFDNSFLALARKTDAWVQPITTLWINELHKRAKVIINFGMPFQVKDMTAEEAYDYYLKVQKCSLEENKRIREYISSSDMS